MNKVTSEYLLINKYFLNCFILLHCLVLSEKVFSRDHWNSDYAKVTYNTQDNTLICTYKFFDYHFGPCHENGYLAWCDFEYTTDGVHYTHLMKAETGDQKKDSWTWMWMKNKKAGANIQFLTCYKPESGTMWGDNSDVRIEVETCFNYVWRCNRLYKVQTAEAFFTIKWFLGSEYQNIRNIRLIGKWHVNGIYIGDKFNEVYWKPVYSVSSKLNNLNDTSLASKNEANASKNNSIKVASEADAIIIKGTDPGENIQIYNTSGVQIKSVITNCNAIKINLPVKRVYIVKIGQASYKIAL